EAGGDPAEAAAVNLLAELVDPGRESVADGFALLLDLGGVFHAKETAGDAQHQGAGPDQKAGGNQADQAALPAGEAAEQAEQAEAGKQVDEAAAEQVGE